MSKPPAGRGHVHKHTHSRKHAHQQQHTRKHHPVHQRGGPGPGGPGPPTVKQHHPHHAKARKLSPGWDVACCSAEALTTLLALSGAPVSHEDSLALYWRTASHPDAGASLLATLEAARPLWPQVHAQRLDVLGADWAGELDDEVRLPVGHPLIVGTVLPEPHAVAVAPDGTWWSWGEPFNPADWPDLVVEEAWAVSWR